MNIADLFARIGIKTEGNQKLSGLHKTLQSVQVGMVAAAGVAVGLAAAIKKITDESFAAAAALKQFEFETGASTENLQKWQQVAEQTNNSAKAVTESIKNLVANQEKIKLGQGDISGYQLLGIDPQQDPFEILEQLREKTKGLTDGMRKNILAQMGISSELIQTLDMSKERFDAMASRAFIIPKSAIDGMTRARGSIQQVGQAVNYLKALIAEQLAPGIEKLNKKIAKWVHQNKDGIIKTITTAFRWITKFSGAVFNAAKMIDEIIRGTIGWKKAMFALIAVIGILNASLLMSPIGLIIAGIILLVAVLDDLYVYSKGGKSLFGKMLDTFPELKKEFEELFGIFVELKDVLVDLFDSENGLSKYVDLMGILKDNFSDMVGYITDSLSAINSVIKLIEGEMSGKDFLEKMGDILPQIVESNLNIATFGAYGAGKNIVNNITNNIKQDISTTANAEETANLVNDKLQKEINSASAQRARDE